LRVPGAFDSFELAIRAVLGQQVSVAGATTVAGRLVQRFGDGGNSVGGDYASFSDTGNDYRGCPSMNWRE
jgi:AraC family transcriptional regulator of adaptative response / DNA-3-methyladenine glycosylase II